MRCSEDSELQPLNRATRHLMRLGLAAVLLLTPLGLRASEAPSGPEIVSKDLTVERIADGVWLHVSYEVLEQFGRTSANGLVIVSGDSAALIDTPWTAAQTEDLMDWVETTLGARVEAVIASHHHADCMGGLEAAHERGAASYASRITAELSRRNGTPLPQHTFERSLSVAVGARQLELFFGGAGHAPGNIVTWVGDVSVLFGGCLVRSASSKSLGYTAEADLAAWPETIRAVRERYGSARVVVPGHGAPGGGEPLARTLELLAE